MQESSVSIFTCLGTQISLKIVLFFKKNFILGRRVITEQMFVLAKLTLFVVNDKICDKSNTGHDSAMSSLVDITALIC